MEGVELKEALEKRGYKIPSLMKRALAMGIDDFLVSFIVMFAFYDSFAKVKTYDEMFFVINQLYFYIILIYTLYHWIFIALYGKTLGKFIVKIKVVDKNTLTTPSFGKSFLRSVMRNFDEMFFYLGMFYAVFDPLNRALHDILSGVVVVEDN